MNEILFQYEKVPATTWVYLSSLLLLALFFKFNRFWSVRNLDLVLLILLAPGLLLVHAGQERLAEQPIESAPTEHPPISADIVVSEDRSGASRTDQPSSGSNGSNTEAGSQATARSDTAPSEDTAETEDTARTESTAQTEDRAPAKGSPDKSAPAGGKSSGPARAATRVPRELSGFVWLLAVGGVLLVRLLVDPNMVRRPLLEPNLSPGGLVFLGCSLFIFLMANVITGRPDPDEPPAAATKPQGLIQSSAAFHETLVKQYGPGYAGVYVMGNIPTVHQVWADEQIGTGVETSNRTVAKTVAILAHLVTVLGVIAIGYWHFNNLRMGLSVATLYLLMPYTAQMTGRVPHVLPAALMVTAILVYRRPLAAGIFIGLAGCTVYYPLFLLPLWTSFYWQRGLWRFATGVLIAVVGMAACLWFLVGADPAAYLVLLRSMFGIMKPVMDDLKGVWASWNPMYRLPVLAAFVAFSFSFALWPAQKNLGTLLSCSAALMVATQFWNAYGGGLFMAWYLPLFLLTVFRPNLEDRVALTVLSPGSSDHGDAQKKRHLFDPSSPYKSKSVA